MPLSARDAALIRGMLRRGDGQMSVAVWFGVNQARVSDVKLGRKHRGVPAAPLDELPPPGPYRVVSAKIDDEKTAKAAALDAVIEQLSSLIQRLQRERANVHEGIEREVSPLHDNGSGGIVAGEASITSH